MGTTVVSARAPQRRRAPWGVTAVGLVLALVLPVQWLGAGRSAAATPGTLIVDTTARARGAIAIVGDSLTYSYLTDLPAQFRQEGWGPFAIEARSARRTLVTTSLATSGLEGVRRIRATGLDPATWIVALGTNDMLITGRTPGLTAATIDGMMREIGPSKRVVWVNVFSRNDPLETAAFNRELAAAAARHPNLTIADWNGLVLRHPDWIVADGVHPTLTGAIGRNDWVSRLAVSRCTAAPAYLPLPAGTVVPAPASLSRAVRLCS